MKSTNLDKEKVFLLYQTLFEQSEDIIFLLDRELRVITLNKKAAGLFQKLPEEVVGKNISQLFPEEIALQYRKSLNMCLDTGESAIYESPMVIQDQIFYISTSLSPIKNTDGTVEAVVGVTRDISVLKNTNDSLREYQRAVEGSVDLIAVVDRNYKYQMVNQAFLDVRGMKRQQVIHKSAEQVLGKKVFKSVVKPNLDRCFNGESVNYEMVNQYEKDGEKILNVTYHPLKSNGMVDRVVAIIRDVTKQRQAEQRVKESEKFLDSVFNSIQDGISVLSPDLKILRANNTMREWYKHQKEFEGESCFRALQGRKKPCESCPVLLTLQSKEIASNEVPLITDEGNQGCLEVFSFPVLDDANNVVMVVEYIKDISKRKEEEKEKLKLLQRLQQSQKMETIGYLAGGIAHNFNNILAVILGLTELTQDSLSSDSELNDNLSEIISSTQRGREVVMQLLSYARKQPTKKIPLYLNFILQDTLTLLKSSLPPNIKIQSQIPDEIKPVKGDSSQITQAIMNVCTNSAEAMKEKGGVLDIAVSEIHIDENMISNPKDKDLAHGDYLQLTVGDTGPGIQQEILPKIFEPFFSAKEDVKKSGMGLPVAQGILREHAGDITVYSELGKGTVFKLYLPILSETYDTPVFEGDDSEIKTGTEKILFVEDQVELLKISRKVLERLGYSVTTRSNGQSALELFKSDPSAFDLIITDQAMPIMKGTELAVEILKLRPGIPIILITGFSEQINDEDYKSHGIAAYAMKPIQMNKIASLIRHVLDPPKP